MSEKLNIPRHLGKALLSVIIVYSLNVIIVID